MVTSLRPLRRGRTAEEAAILRSLKLRVLALAAMSLGVALMLSWVLLTRLFEERLEARIFAELESHLEQLTQQIEPVEASDSGDAGGDSGDVSGGVDVIEALAEPRFGRPFSGLYWQVIASSGESRELLTSESLWDEELTFPEVAPPPGQIVRHLRLRFQSGEVIAVERSLVLPVGEDDLALRLMVALDRVEVDQARQSFADRVLMLVAVLGGFLMLAAMVQIVVGLRPLAKLRARLNAMRAGEAARLEGRFPSEIQGLVDELNGLLTGREEMVERARARAGDLAHGLKTPLAVLAAESRRLAAEGQQDAADEITAQIDRMNRNVERELVRARAHGSGGGLSARTDLVPAVQRLLRAFGRMADGDRIEWSATIPPGATITLDQGDLDELAGNLLDNARKWARGRVSISAEMTAAGTRLTIEDDGPGIPPNEIDQVLMRGGRLDQAAPGSGLGLAIARDILDLYEGRLEMTASPMGGLAVVVIVPAAPAGFADPAAS